jgi:hypothetical protein
LFKRLEVSAKVTGRSGISSECRKQKMDNHIQFDGKSWQLCSIIILSILLLTVGCSKPITSQSSATNYLFFTGQGPSGGIVLWRCDSRTGQAWWTASGQQQYWHLIAGPTPDFATLRPITNALKP